MIGPLPEVTILALDPSTDLTGAALLRFTAKGSPSVLDVREFDAKELLRERWDAGIEDKAVFKADAVTARIARIRAIRGGLASWLSTQTNAFDLVAYEIPFMRGAGASEALPQACGAYLSLSALAGCKVIPVYTASVKAVIGKLRESFATNAGRKAQTIKRDALKIASVDWANATFGLTLEPGDDAVADACAVGVAAWKIWHLEQVKAAQEKPKKSPAQKKTTEKCA